MAISRMQQPRQMYGLGSIVKKAVRGVKKVAKSPLGKAAIAGAIGFGIPGTSIGGLFGRAGFGGAATGLLGKQGIAATLPRLFGSGMLPPSEGMAKPGLFGKAKGFFNNMSTGQKIFTGLGATALAAPFLAGGPEEVVEEAEDQIDVDAIKQSARDFYMGTGGKNLSFMPKKEYVDQNFYAQQSAADGGRIGYSSGQLVSPSNDGSRPGYAGPLDFFKNLKSGVGQIFSGETSANLGGDQEKINEFNVLKGYGIDLPKETIELIVNGYRDGADIDTISALSGTDANTVTGIISMLTAKADGGRIGYAMGGNTDDEDEVIRMTAGQRIMPRATFLNMGGGAGQAQAEQMLMAEFVKYKNQGGDLSFEQFVKAVMQQQEQAQGMEQPMAMAADGGRIGYSEAGIVDPLTKFEIIRLGNMGYDVEGKGEAAFGGLKVLRDILKVNNFADGGMAGMSVPGYGTPAGTNQFGYPSGGARVNAAEGGIMATDEASEMIDMGGMEKDYREEGGFVAMGGEERADDVPARLSRNEFVFTADAVRNAGGGDIDRGSEVMQNLMDNLEQGGQVSEDSQGLGGGEEMMSEEIIEEPDGAQAMYEQQQALQSRMI